MNKLNLKKMRENNDLTSKYIANILNVSTSVYLRWERNDVTIPTIRLFELSNFYEINIDYLLGLTNKKIHTEKTLLNRNVIMNNIREIRKDYNESLRSFTKRLNTSSSTWSAYETGKTLILCSFLIEICLDNGYSADWILGRSNIKYINKPQYIKQSN